MPWFVPPSSSATRASSDTTAIMFLLALPSNLLHGLQVNVILLVGAAPSKRHHKLEQADFDNVRGEYPVLTMRVVVSHQLLAGCRGAVGGITARMRSPRMDNVAHEDGDRVERQALEGQYDQEGGRKDQPRLDVAKDDSKHGSNRNSSLVSPTSAELLCLLRLRWCHTYSVDTPPNTRAIQ